MDLDRCPVALTVDVMGGKWKPTILFHLKDGPRRFNELRRLMPEITQRMLTLQLRALEADGIVTRKAHDEVPPRVEYALSRFGWTLGPILEAMVAWGEEHGEVLRPHEAGHPAFRPDTAGRGATGKPGSRV